MKKTMMMAVALLGLSSQTLMAQSVPAPKAVAMVASAPGTGTLAEAVSISAQVVAIDKAQRQLVLRGPRGGVETITAGAEVRNFDQIKVNDLVVVRYMQALTLTLKKDGKVLPAMTGGADGVRAAAGEKPAGIVGHQVEVTADVIAVDAKTQTLTLKGPKQTVELRVPDAGQFKLVKVGDQIQAVYTEALAISVEAAPAKK